MIHLENDKLVIHFMREEIQELHNKTSSKYWKWYLRWCIKYPFIKSSRVIETKEKWLELYESIDEEPSGSVLSKLEEGFKLLGINQSKNKKDEK